MIGFKIPRSKRKNVEDIGDAKTRKCIRCQTCHQHNWIP